MKKRQLSPYEKTHLQRFGKSDINIDDYGEMPVEQITGKVEFGEYVFEVTADVLIPRIESEELISLAIDQVRKLNKKKVSIADIGCGSGAIGISIFLALQNKDISTEMYLSDVSPKALSVAEHNSIKLIKNQKIKLIESDLLSSYPTDTKFDLIIANLPYIPSPRIQVLDASVTDYEPHLALDGGVDGLTLIKRLIEQAKIKLKPKGSVLLEVDYTHDENFLKKNLSLEGLSIEVRQDQFHRTRFVILSKK